MGGRSDSRAYFERLVELGRARPTLEPLAHPCGDCAVVCEFYGDVADELALQSPELRAAVLRTWDCHNALRSRGCRGAVDRVALKARAA